MEIKKCLPQRILKGCSLEAFNYQMDPYIGCEHLCCYCYDLNSTDLNWEKEIMIHEDIIGKLAREIEPLEPQTIYIGMNTDPYQPAEKEYFQTRKVIELLLEKGFSVSILTKSGLVTRDIDLLSSDANSSVGVSIAFHNEDIRKLFEKKAPAVDERVKALQELKNSGIRTYTLICPVIPFITAVEPIIEMVEPYSDAIWIYKLQMENKKDRNWANVKRIIRDKFPRLTDSFTEVVFAKSHPYWECLRNNLKSIKKAKAVAIKIEF